jgi:PhnB protein
MTDAPPPLTGVTPHLMIGGGRAAEAIDFYGKAFGATEASRVLADDGKRLLHVHLNLAGGALLLHDDFPEMAGGEPAPAPSGVVLHLEVPDADVAWDQALAAGATARFPIANQFWGARYGQLNDPFGHIWSIGGPAKE